MPAKMIPWSMPRREAEWQARRGGELLAEMEGRRSCRHFSDKPVSRETLLRALEIAHLAPSGANRRPWRFVVIDDLAINVDSAQVTRGAQIVNLTPTEYRLFLYLARHAGQALSRSQILQAVWNDAGGIESERTVNVHIRRLRQKVELEPSKPALILTVPGIGYRLVTES